MNYSLLKEKEAVINQSVIKEEELGTATDLMQNNTVSLSTSVRNEIQKLSVLEIIA